jgi:hypothetical protein
MIPETRSEGKIGKGTAVVQFMIYTLGNPLKAMIITLG